MKLKSYYKWRVNDQRFNLHTHTMRCGHALGLDIQYVESAIDAGIELLGFSDHIPFIGVYSPGDRMNYKQKDEYLDNIRKLQKEYRDRIEIKVGYEYLMEMKKDCDYMILGQHLKYIGYEYDYCCLDADVLEYIKQIERAVKKNFITYIAHTDHYMLEEESFLMYVKKQLIALLEQVSNMMFL